MTPQKDLTEAEVEAYSRQIALDEIGYQGQVKLRNARVCVVGIGGLGNISAMRLTAMGVGYLRLVDRDVVSRSDLHRQTLYDVDLIGYPKVEAAAKKLCRLNPDVELDPAPAPVTESNVDQLLKDVNIVIDGLDRVSPRYIINRACHRLKIPYVFGSAIELYGNASTIIPDKTPCLECFYVEIKNDDLPRCAVVGVHPSVVGVIANVQLYEAVNLILGRQPSLAGKIFYADLRHMAFDSVEIRKRDTCPVCGSTTSTPSPPSSGISLDETCGREGGRTFVITPPQLFDADLSRIRVAAESAGRKIALSSHFGVTFTHSEGIQISFLKSGCMVLVASQQASKKIAQKDVLGLYLKYREIAARN